MAMYGLPQGLLKPPPPVAEDASEGLRDHGRLGQAPGTMILVFVFLAAFAIYFFANFKMLSFVWKVG